MICNFIQPCEQDEGNSAAHYLLLSCIPVTFLFILRVFPLRTRTWFRKDGVK